MRIVLRALSTFLVSFVKSCINRMRLSKVSTAASPCSPRTSSVNRYAVLRMSPRMPSTRSLVCTQMTIDIGRKLTSNPTIFCSTSLSKIVKSSLIMSCMYSPLGLRTVTGTVTWSMSSRKIAGWSDSKRVSGSNRPPSSWPSTAVALQVSATTSQINGRRMRRSSVIGRSMFSLAHRPRSQGRT